VRAPFQLELPAEQGVKITFADATAASFGGAAADYHGPVGVLDLQHDGRCSLFVAENNGFRFLLILTAFFSRSGLFIPHSMAQGSAAAWWAI